MERIPGDSTWPRMTSLAGSALLAFLFVAMTGVGAATLGGPLAGVLSEGTRGRTLAAFGASAAGQVACVLALLVVFKLRQVPLFEPNAFGRPRETGWLAAAGAAALFIAAIGLGQVRGQPLAELSSFNILGSLLAGPVTGTAEELISRGAILARLATGGWKPPMQVVLSGLLFGLPHGVAQRTVL